MNALTTTAAALSLAAACSGGALAQEAGTVNFGIISTESQSNLRTKWEPFLADMEERTGLEVEPFFASDYAGVIEGMRFDKVDLAWFGNKSAMEAVDRANGEVFTQTVDVSGNPGYWSLILVPADSPIETVDDLLDCDGSLDFGMGDPNSTSGFLVPTTFVFAARGVDPQDCFANVTNANHETNAMAVAMGQVDAATNNTESLALIEENNPEAFEKIKVIWKSPLIPSDPIVWRGDLAPEAKAAVEDFFLTYGTERSSGDVVAEKEVLASLGWAPFQAVLERAAPAHSGDGARRRRSRSSRPTQSMSAEERAAEVKRLGAEKAGYEAEIAASGQS